MTKAKRTPRKWTPEELAVVETLRDESVAVDSVARTLGRSKSSVRNQAIRMGIGRRDNRPWTEDDFAVLRQWYTERQGGRLDRPALAQKLGRSEHSVAIKAARLGLTDPFRKSGRKPRAKYASPEEARRAAGEATRRRFAEGGHPRGMLGKKHTPEVRARISKTQRRLAEMGIHPGQLQVHTPERRMQSSMRMTERLTSGGNVYSRCKYGRRADLGGQFFRSAWEANYARFLNFLKARGEIEKWEYEADTFWFEKIKRGVRCYTPDFKVTERGGHQYYVEVKGWLDAKSKTKLKRMKKYHPKVDLRLVGERAYREIERKLSGAIPGWETRHTRSDAA